MQYVNTAIMHTQKCYALLNELLLLPVKQLAGLMLGWMVIPCGPTRST
jgi:hypothetical protein